jgi:hypothetical protein
MGWTDPRTWVTDEVVTAGIMNTHVRDNLLALPHLFHAENTNIPCSNTTNQTSQFTTPPVIPADALGESGRIIIEIWGDYLYNNSQTLTYRVKFGGTTHITNTHISGLGLSGTTFSYKTTIDILNKGATDSQHIHLHVIGPNTAGEPDLLLAGSRATGTIDTTADQTLDVSVQWGGASSSVAWDKEVSRVYIAQA